jgi:ribosomal protein S18 acetylase RimI-like enzyme
MLTIRAALLIDAPTLLELMTPFNAFEGIPFTKEKVAPALEALITSPSIGFVRVAEHEGAVVGYVVVTFGFDLEFAGRDAFVTELFVTEAARGTGVARALLARAERDAREAEVRALHLVVRPENTAAIALYEAQGFATIPRKVMTKKLT